MGIQGTLKRLARELNPAVDGIPVERDEIDTAVAGTHNPRHPQTNVKMITDNLPIPQWKNFTLPPIDAVETECQVDPIIRTAVRLK